MPNTAQPHASMRVVLKALAIACTLGALGWWTFTATKQHSNAGDTSADGLAPLTVEAPTAPPYVSKEERLPVATGDDPEASKSGAEELKEPLSSATEQQTPASASKHGFSDAQYYLQSREFNPNAKVFDKATTAELASLIRALNGEVKALAAREQEQVNLVVDAKIAAGNYQNVVLNTPVRRSPDAIAVCIRGTKDGSKSVEIVPGESIELDELQREKAALSLSGMAQIRDWVSAH